MSYELIKRLDLKSAQTGISKSKLIRSWIGSYSGEKFIVSRESPDNKADITYNFYLDWNLEKLLISHADNINLTLSSFLRALIKSHVYGERFPHTALKTDIKPIVTSVQLKEHWRKGRLIKISKLASDIFNELNSEDKLILIKSEIYSGNYKKAQSFITQMQVQVSKRDQLNSLYFHSAQAELYKATGELRLAQLNAQKAQQLAHQTGNRELLAQSYFILAEISLIQGDKLQAHHYYTDTLEHLDCISYPQQMGVVYFRLGNFYSQMGYPQRGYDFFKRSLPMLHVDHNAYALSWYYSEKYLYDSLIGNIKESKECVRLCLYYCQKSGTYQHLFDIYRYYLNLRILKGSVSYTPKLFMYMKSIENYFANQFNRSISCPICRAAHSLNTFSL